MSECIHGLDASWCSTCKHGPEKPERDRLVFTLSARFDGQCPECNLSIMVGQVIGRLEPSGRYVHARCQP